MLSPKTRYNVIREVATNKRFSVSVSKNASLVKKIVLKNANLKAKET